MALTEHGFNWKTSPSGLIIPSQADNPSLGPGVVDVEFEHKTSGLAAGSYGDSSHYPAVTVDAYGHITAVTLEASGGGGGGGGGVLFDSTLGADAASIDSGAGGFSTSYAVLEIWVVARTSEAAVTSVGLLTFNADTGANYTRETISATGTTLASSNGTGQTAIRLTLAGSSASANIFAPASVVVPAYASTAFHKSAIYLGGAELGSTASAFVTNIHRWANTAAITRVTLTANSGNLKTGSRLIVMAR